MIKVIVLALALFSVVNCQLAGGLTDVDSSNAYVQDIARWATNQLSGYTNIDGVYYLLRVRNVRQQVVSGVKYYFTNDIMISLPNNKFQAHSCDVVVYDQPWTNTRQIVGTPTCVENPNLIGGLVGGSN